MPIQPPSRAELARIAEAYHLGLSGDELATFAELAGPTLAGFGRLDELPDETLPVCYPRVDVGHRPTGEENPSNGWSRKCSIPGALDVAVVGKPDPVMGEEPVAFAALKEGSTTDEQELLAFAKQRLARYKLPKEVRLIEALPRNAVGKVAKRDLRERVKP